MGLDEMKEINFRMDLLREDTELSKYIYDCNLTSKQWEAIRELYRKLEDRIYKGEKVTSSEYEHEILSLVDNRTLDYHFAESVAKIYWENNQYKEIFETLYKDSAKFSHHFK